LRLLNTQLVTTINYEVESVNTYITNGSETTVMDVIGFQCVSLDSSTVQLHESLGSRSACAFSEVVLSSKNGDRA
jgi:hypothetical protein